MCPNPLLPCARRLSRLLLLSAAAGLSAAAAQTGPVNPAAPAVPRALSPASAASVPAPRIRISSPTHHLHRGRANQITVTGDLVKGERVYLAGSTIGPGNGPCFTGAGGLCLSLRGPRNLLGTAVAVRAGQVVIEVTPPGLGEGTPLWLQAVVVRSVAGAESIASPVQRLTLATGPVEGSVLTEWTPMAFNDNGYRNGCAGGGQYVKSTHWASPRYVGVTRCTDEREYKIWLSDELEA